MFIESQLVNLSQDQQGKPFLTQAPQTTGM